jgi:5-methylcytosine-specific restriction endonuclease McrA
MQRRKSGAAPGAPSTAPTTRPEVAPFVRRKRARQDPTREQVWACWAAADSWACIYCGAPWAHVEHFYPLASGGAHAVGNLWPSCEDCNLEKSDSHPAEFLRSRGVVLP